MSIEDDVVLLQRVPTLRLLGAEALRVLAIGSEQQDFARDTVVFRSGDAADCGYVVRRGTIRVRVGDGDGQEVIAEAGALIGELALIVPMQRPATAVVLDHASVLRISRGLFQRVLESEPAAALRLRDALADRAGQATSDIVLVGARLTM